MNKTSNTKLLIFLLSFDLLLTIFLVLFTEDSRRYYKEGQLVTIYSGLKLLTTSLICWKIFKYKEGILSLKQLKNPIFIWLIISAGFLFLALDELALIHESIDKLIHHIFSMEETSLTDRIDDLIIFVYGLIGIYILYRYKDEILKYRFIIKFKI